MQSSENSQSVGLASSTWDPGRSRRRSPGDRRPCETPLHLCHCGSHRSDDGHAISNARDLTHSGGFLSCMRTPSSEGELKAPQSNRGVVVVPRGGPVRTDLPLVPLGVTNRTPVRELSALCPADPQAQTHPTLSSCRSLGMPASARVEAGHASSSGNGRSSCTGTGRRRTRSRIDYHQ